jgi:hypothetical protein
MFGIGLLVILAAFAGLLYKVTNLFRGWKSKTAFVLLVLGTVITYPSAYKLSPSYAQFLELCDSSIRYHVLKTKPVEYIFLDRDSVSDCQAGPTYIEGLSFAGFDCVAPVTETTTAIFRFTKKQEWHVGCGIECFNSRVIEVAEARYKYGHRQGYIDGSTITVTFDESGYRGPESSGDKLRFSDTLLIDAGVEMAFKRSYMYYPYGSGWATILGAASGSAPSRTCKAPFVPWNLRDIYKPKDGM